MEKAQRMASARDYRRVVGAIYLGALIVAGGLISWQFNQIRKETDRVATERGASLFKLIEVTREWNARNGGVYAPTSGDNPPNPHLDHPRRDITDNFGRRLTLVNPAYMTRQISEIAAQHEGIRFHITSLRPIRPANQADAWEAEALKGFERTGGKERISFLDDGGGIVPGPVYRFMAPLMMRKACLDCHQAQGYKVGDVRGGISVTMPADELLAIARTRQWQAALFSVFGAALLAWLAHFIAYRIHRHFRVLTELNGQLEEKIAARTLEVKKLYEHEHYLRELLSTVSEINIALIHSYSMGSIIESAIERLKHHESYKLIMFGHFDGTRFHIRHSLGDRYGRLHEGAYELGLMLNSPLLRSTARAIRNRHWQTSGPSEESGGWPMQRADDYQLSASIAFPLIDGDAGVGFEVITFWTDRAEGFEQEEIRILDAVASDITMALSAYKQRKLSERLYQEHIDNYEETILAFVDMIEQRDAYTAGHTLRVARYSRLIAEQMQMDERDIVRLEKAAILHDIGKIATPDTILLKPGRLSALEYSLIQMHVSAGYKMLSKVKMYSELAEIIKFHHERCDGRGYPNGYKGDEIPRAAQIMIVADAFDAMTTNRIYKGRLTVPTAIAELKNNSGTQFHPEVVDAAIACLADITIDDVDQLPSSALEKQRFAYFFNDMLTGVFNPAYLHLIVNRDERYCYAIAVQLKHFTEFNREQGWAAGNELLINVAHLLRSAFPDALVFRFHGDDFLVLGKQPVEPDPASVVANVLDATGIVSVERQQFDLRTASERERFNRVLEIK